MAGGINMDGMNAKLRRMGAINVFVKNILRDSAEFFRGKMINEQLAGAPGTIPTAGAGARVIVGRVSKKLVDSHATLRIKKGITQIFSDESIAPYSAYVAKLVKKYQDRTYMEVTKFFYEAEIRAGFKREFKRMIGIVDAGGQYTYQNPYPPV